MRFELIISLHMVQTNSEIRTGFSTETTKYFSTIVMHPFHYVVTINLALTSNKTIFQRMHNENFGVLSTAKCGMHKSIKLNYFKHINILESCKQPGIDNKSSNFIPEMVSCVEMKIQGFFCKKISKVQ